MQSEQIRVAVIDDDPLFLDYVSELLGHQGGMRVTKATDGDQLFKELDKGYVECVLVDYNLGNENGFDVAERIKQRYDVPPPMVLLTGRGGERTVVKSFRLGLSDYVSKRNLNTSELVGAIRGAVDRHRQTISSRAELEFHKQQSAYDGSTGLYSASHIKKCVAKLTSATIAPKPFALIAIRMNGIARIEKTFGRLVADRALRAFGQRVQASTRAGDICGRIRDDAFVTILDTSAAPKSLSTVSDRLEKLKQHLSFETDFDTVTLQLSATLAVARYPEDGSNFDALLEHAAILTDTAAENQDKATAQPESHANCVGARPERRRNDRRHRVLKRGRIYVVGMNSVVDCTIRNLSEYGAMLRVNSFFVAPDTFELMVVGASGRQPVTTRWQTGLDFGVQFVNPGDGRTKLDG